MLPGNLQVRVSCAVVSDKRRVAGELGLHTNVAAQLWFAYSVNFPPMPLQVSTRLEAGSARLVGFGVNVFALVYWSFCSLMAYSVNAPFMLSQVARPHVDGIARLVGFGVNVFALVCCSFCSLMAYFVNVRFMPFQVVKPPKAGIARLVGFGVNAFALEF